MSLRITGLYFALVTLSYGLVAEQNIFQIEELTGGGQGQPAPKPDGFETDWRYYYLCLAFLALVLWLDWRMMRTKAGGRCSPAREPAGRGDVRRQREGRYTLFAFVVSGAFAGLGGALLAHNDTFVSPEMWNFNLALVFVIMTVVGGLRSRAGVVIGSAFFALLGYLLEKFARSSRTASTPSRARPTSRPRSRRSSSGPILLLLTLTLFPGGIGQQIRPIIRLAAGGRFDLKDRGPKEVQISDVRA